MRLKQARTFLLQERLEDLAIVQPAVDELAQALAHLVGLAAAVGIARSQRVEVPRADVAAHSAGAVDARQKPFDPLRPVARPVHVRRELILLYRLRWGSHL